MNARWMTVSEVAERLHVSRPTAGKHLKTGAVPGRVLHLGYHRVEREVFEKWLKIKDRVKTV